MRRRIIVLLLLASVLPAQSGCFTLYALAALTGDTGSPFRLSQEARDPKWEDEDSVIWGAAAAATVVILLVNQANPDDMAAWPPLPEDEYASMAFDPDSDWNFHDSDSGGLVERTDP